MFSVYNFHFVQTSEVPTYRKMWNYMSTASPPVMVKTVEEGVERVRNSKGKYAFLIESSMNNYYNNRKPCDTVRVGGDLNLEGFGIATPHGSDLKYACCCIIIIYTCPRKRARVQASTLTHTQYTWERSLSVIAT